MRHLASGLSPSRRPRSAADAIWDLLTLLLSCAQETPLQNTGLPMNEWMNEISAARCFIVLFRGPCSFVCRGRSPAVELARRTRESAMKQREWRHFDPVSSNVSGITGIDRCILAMCLSTPQKRRVSMFFKIITCWLSYTSTVNMQEETGVLCMHVDYGIIIITVVIYPKPGPGFL